MKRILIVDDESLVSGPVSIMVKRLGCEAYTASKGEEAVGMFRQEEPHLTILDLGLPDISGLEVLKRIEALVPDHPIIILTGAGREDLEAEARELGASEFFLKGSSFLTLKQAIQRLMVEA